MRIIHLSDLHLDRKDGTTITNITEKLVNVLKVINAEKEIDLILFSGDLINTGGLSYDKIEKSFLGFEMIFADKLLKSLNIPRSRFIFTIGNHDIDRTVDSKFTEIGLSSNLKTVKSVNEFYDSDPDEGVKRILPFKKFEKKFYKDCFSGCNLRQTKFESCYKFEIGKTKIGICCLNTAWRCWNSKEDKGNIVMGTNQIQKSQSFLKDCDIKIAMSHHHYNWMADFEIASLDKLIIATFDMYFSGHTHSPNSEYCVKPEGRTFKFVAPGILSANTLAQSQFTNGFSVIDYCLEEGKVNTSIYLQEYSSEFKINKNHGIDGIWTVDIPMGEDAKIKMETQNVLLNIKEEISILNEHLLSYNTPTKAPKSLNEIFVMPYLTKKEEDKNELDDILCEKDAEEVTIDDLSELIESKNNYVIFGIKESGKTVLLDKIFFEILNKCNIERSIPVLLDFKGIKSDIESNIRDCWHKSKTEMKRLLAKEKIVFLIDNIIFEDHYKDKLLILNKFLEEHSNVRFIATSLEYHNNEITVSPDLQSFLHFVRLEIKQFRSKQIRELVKKWFPENTQYETPKKMDMLINAFFTLNLPRTPFAISMFLWIIERQESYRPQNNALLIENFIKELLKTKDPKGGLRETFDYENKIRLLSELAHYMLINDNKDYSLPYVKIIELTDKHLEKRKFKNSYSSRQIIQEILDLSIFIEDESSVRFRFNCFFEYFLVKKMENTPSFKDEVMEEKNYLKYFNEIIYFTGLNRGDKEILTTVISRLEYDYIDINEIVFTRVKSIDEFFNVNKSIIQSIKADELFELLPEKQTEEQKDDKSDIKLKCNPEKEQEIIKKKKSNKFNNYSRLLLLAMNVLKNSEEVEEEELKTNSYDVILRNSISYAILYKLICEEILAHSKSFSKDRVDDFSFSLRFLPVIHQELVSEHLGTYKLSEVMIEKMQSDKENNVSEFEHFLSVFMYCDIQAKNYKTTMLNFVNSIDRAYIADACFFKLLSYYHSSSSDDYDRTLLNAIGDLYIRMNADKNPNKRINKGKIMEQFKRDKKDKLQKRTLYV